MALSYWNVDDDEFYANEGKGIATRQLNISMPNLALGFGVWLMWSVICAKIQQVHTDDPSVYYFKEFSPSHEGVSDGYRGCPGWYEYECCKTWLEADQSDFDQWKRDYDDGEFDEYDTAEDFLNAKDFKSLKVAPADVIKDQGPGFAGYTDTGDAYGCKVNADRSKSYKAMLYMLPAAAGLSGGIFRLPNSFVIPVAGGRNVIFFTTLLLSIPCLWAAIALSSGDVGFLTLTGAAIFSGVGGGSFASSMANISTFYPKRLQGYGLGMNGGLGNLGVSFVQLVLPQLFKACGVLTAVGGACISTGCWFLFPICIAAAFAAYLWMNNMPRETHPVPENYARLLFEYCSLQLPSYAAAIIGVTLLYGTSSVATDAFKHPAAAVVRILIVIIVAAAVEHAFIHFLAPPTTKKKLKVQYQMYKDKHTYWMTYLYIMTFGSFIGYSSAFPKLIVDLFEEYGEDECAEKMAEDPSRDDCINPDAPDTFVYAWTGAAIGSLIRPVGGIMSDRWGGARVTHYHTLLMTAVTYALAVICLYAKNAKRNRLEYFPGFFLCFLLLFYGTGVGNGSTFRQIGVIFDKTLAPCVLGWSSAIASFGAFLIPAFFGVFIKEVSELLLLSSSCGRRTPLLCEATHSRCYTRRARCTSPSSSSARTTSRASSSTGGSTSARDARSRARCARRRR